MSYFLFDGKLEVGKKEFLEGEEGRHIFQSRRLREGDCLEVQDLEGERFQASILSLLGQKVEFMVNTPLSVPPPSPLQLEILLLLPKEKALDWILQKSTELGVSELIIIQGQHSPQTIKNSQKEHSLKRWERILWEACKQSGRQFPPKLAFEKDLETPLKQQPPCLCQWVLEPTSSDSFSNAKASGRSAFSSHHRVLIGPEGGVSEEELNLALSHNMKPVSLGPRILRVETAVVAIISILQFLEGDFAK
ncbi:RsmE family RNA methyltransferase [Deltaproteobacteria bacterium TL4]